MPSPRSISVEDHCASTTMRAEMRVGDEERIVIVFDGQLQNEQYPHVLHVVEFDIAYDPAAQV